MTSGEKSLNRSTAGRSRRTQRRAGKAVQRRNKTTRGRNVPAMVARNPRMEEQLNQGRSEARRRYPLKLATEGAELHLPALPVLHFGWRTVSTGLLVSLLLSLYLLLTVSSFTVGRVQLSGAQRISAQDVNAALNISGSPIYAIQPDQISAAIAKAFPELENFAVSVGFPANVLIEVREREPLIAWEQSGIVVWVDQAGIAFIPEGSAENLVTVQALEPPPALEGSNYSRHQLIEPGMVSAILALSEHKPEEAKVLFDPKLGFGWEDPNGWSAYFGAKATDMEQRLAVYQSVVTELNDRGLRPTLISVAQLHAPYYRMDY